MAGQGLGRRVPVARVDSAALEKPVMVLLDGPQPPSESFGGADEGGRLAGIDGWHVVCEQFVERLLDRRHGVATDHAMDTSEGV